MPPTPQASPGPLVARVLVVCTANITRSPFAAALLAAEARRRLGPEAPVWVDSAGVHAPSGSPASEVMARLAADRGLDLSTHRSRPLAAADVRDADLVTVMSRSQRDWVQRLALDARDRVFLLPELVRLLDVLAPPAGALAPTERIREVVRGAHAARPWAPAPTGPEDVADPHGGPASGYAEVADRLADLVGRVAATLFVPAEPAGAGGAPRGA